MSNKFNIEKGTKHPPPLILSSYTRTYQQKLEREMFYVSTNPCIFSHYGVALVTDLRKLADSLIFETETMSANKI
jgi:hypothetical protein